MAQLRHSALPLLVALCTQISGGIARAQESTPDRRRTPVVEVFQEARDAVVNISTSRRVQYRYNPSFSSPLDDIFSFGAPPMSDQVVSVGSGAVIHRAGYVVTNAHVVAQATDIHVTFADNSTLPAEIVAIDSPHDLAILKVDGERKFQALKLGRTDDILIGETVVAIGNPLGLNHTVTTGIVSALARELRFAPNLTYTGLIQTDASINPGNSGGPLLNLNAELIGINTAIRGDAQNIGFAIPVARLWELIPTMLDIERRARVRFGLEVEGATARIRNARPGSPAFKAGLRSGDVLTKFEDDALRDGIDYYVHLSQLKPGATVRLTARRADEQFSVSVPLEEIPPPDGRKLSARLLGLGLEEVPPSLRRHRDFPRNLGLMVGEVESGSPADRAGLEPGDLIVSVDGLNVPTYDDAGLVLERVQAGEPVLVDVIRLKSDPPIRGTARLQARRPN